MSTQGRSIFVSSCSASTCFFGFICETFLSLFRLVYWLHLSLSCFCCFVSGFACLVMFSKACACSIVWSTIACKPTTPPIISLDPGALLHVEGLPLWRVVSGTSCLRHSHRKYLSLGERKSSRHVQTKHTLGICCRMPFRDVGPLGHLTSLVFWPRSRRPSWACGIAWFRLFQLFKAGRPWYHEKHY